MRWLLVCCVLAIGGLIGVGVAASGSPQAVAARCAKGSTPAVIGGKRTCLKVGRRCAKALDRQYHRYKFHCHSGRLTRGRPPVPLTPVTFALNAVEGSGVTGTATITPLNANNIGVSLDLSNQPPGDLPAHIHFDTCENVSGIRYGLSNVVNGRSETAIATPIAYLRRGHGRFSINVHRAEPDLPIIACGDIPPA